MVVDGVTDVLLFPQYPHYAMSSWETVVVKVQEEAAKLVGPLAIATVQPFYEDADYIEALYQVSAPYLAMPHDMLLVSYHGIPVRHLRKGDSSNAHCTLVNDCCNTCSPAGVSPARNPSCAQQQQAVVVSSRVCFSSANASREWETAESGQSTFVSGL
jgi:ferrochelatase